MDRMIRQALLGLIRLYQLAISPYIGRQCRFYPTCSHYAQEAIIAHGPATGIELAVRRLLKCHPFHPGGVDLVPQAKELNAGPVCSVAPDQAEEVVNVTA